MKRIAIILLAALLCGAVVFIHTSPKEDATRTLINQDGSINLSLREHPYIPKEGDVIRCEDGSNYTIIHTDGYDIPAPPTDDYGQTELPEAEAIHFTDVSGDYLFLRNLRETVRMASTLSDALGIEVASIQLHLPEDSVPDVSHAWDVRQAVTMPGSGAYGVEAWDIFKNGTYVWTSYEVART